MTWEKLKKTKVCLFFILRTSSSYNHHYGRGFMIFFLLSLDRLWCFPCKQDKQVEKRENKETRTNTIPLFKLLLRPAYIWSQNLLREIIGHMCELLYKGELIAGADSVNQRNSFHYAQRKKRIGEHTNKADNIGIYMVSKVNDIEFPSLNFYHRLTGLSNSD